MSIPIASVLAEHYLHACVFVHRRFDQLSELMSECDNGQRYQEEIEKLMAANEPFIPFLGFFLTKVSQSTHVHSIVANVIYGKGRQLSI